MGVVLGVIGACLMFALSYSRIGVIRRHLTRGEFSSNVERAPEQTRLLREEGERAACVLAFGLHLLRLVQRAVRAHQAGDRCPGREAGRLCRARFQRGARARYLGGVEPHQAPQLLQRARRHPRLLRPERGDARKLPEGRLLRQRRSRIRSSARRNEAIEWCEDMLLMYHEVGEASAHSFESWLTQEFGGAADMSRIAPYLERHELNSRRGAVPAGRAAELRRAPRLGLRRHHHQGRAGASDQAPAHDGLHGRRRDGLLPAGAAHRDA